MSRKSKRNHPNPGHREPQAEPVPTRSRFRRLGSVIVIVAADLVASGVGTLLFKNKGTPSGPLADTSTEAALASNQAPTLGDANAKVHIVEFLDPACETCAQFYPLVKKLVADNPGQVRVSLRHVAFHEGSDYVVRVLEASRKQDKYWPTLEAVLASQAIWAPNHTAQPDLVLQAIAGVGLDMAQLMADMNAPEVAERMQNDSRDAITMKVTATPEYFVNGRSLPSFGDQQLLELVREELQKTY
jgi:protein-disulfide isomerase